MEKHFEGSGRSSTVGNDKGTMFIVGFEHPEKEKRITRLKQYPRKEPNPAEMEQKQRAAARRKQVI